MLIKIGTLRHPHGIKGGLLLRLVHDGPSSVLKKGLRLWICPEGVLSSDKTPYTLTKFSAGPKVIIYLEGIDDRNSSEALLPCDVYAEREDFPRPEDSNEVYCIDLIGVPVYDYENKAFIGTVLDTYSNGAQEIIVIKRENGEEDLDLPFTEHFFPLVDIDNKRIEVRLPEWI